MGTRLSILPLALTMLSLAGSVLVKGSLVEALAAQVQYPICSCLVLENLTEQSLLLFPNAGNCRTGNGWVVGVAVVAIVGIVVAEITREVRANGTDEYSVRDYELWAISAIVSIEIRLDRLRVVITQTKKRQ